MQTSEKKKKKKKKKRKDFRDGHWAKLAWMTHIHYKWFILMVSKVKLATIVKGYQRAPFSIATTPKCRGGHYSFPWIAPLYPRYTPYISKEVSNTIFKVFGMTGPGIGPRSPRSLANTTYWANEPRTISSLEIRKAHSMFIFTFFCSF